jgi:hypothetical protein
MMKEMNKIVVLVALPVSMFGIVGKDAEHRRQL